MIMQRASKPSRYKVPEVDLAVVFEFVDNVANDTASAIRGDCCVEVNRAMRTVRAGKRGVERPVEGL
jgi:hypothetical protein